MVSKFGFSIVIIVLLTSLFSNTIKSQNKDVNWLTIEEAVNKLEDDPRKIFVDIYTDWCGFCRRMNNNTFSHPVIIEILNNKFHPVKLNAEQEEPIEFQGREYINENPGERRSAHNFAVALLQGQMSYPSFAFFDEELNLITALPGYKAPEEFEPILIFFYNDEYKTSHDLNRYIKQFEGKVE